MNEDLSEEYDALLEITKISESDEAKVYLSMTQEDLIDLVKFEKDQLAFAILVESIRKISGLGFLESKKIAQNWTINNS